jgi:hypothetical protein
MLMHEMEGQAKKKFHTLNHLQSHRDFHTKSLLSFFHFLLLMENSTDGARPKNNFIHTTMYTYTYFTFIAWEIRIRVFHNNRLLSYMVHLY